MESISESSQQQKRKPVTHGLEDQKRCLAQYETMAEKGLKTENRPLLPSTDLWPAARRAVFLSVKVRTTQTA